MKRIVIKVGTAVLTGKNGLLDEAVFESLAEQVSKLMDDGIEAVIVTSGAIGAGMGLLSIKKRPAGLADLQSLASIGQTKLMDTYNKYFSKENKLTGQILLTQDDFNDRKRFLNIRNTIDTLLKRKVVPLVNENDTISTEEIKCGDNDRLSSLVAGLILADTLIILSNVDGLLDKDGNVVPEVGCVDESVKRLIRNKASEQGKGGMYTKIKAAELAMSSGIMCYIANGKTKDVVINLLKSKGLCTCFRPGKQKISGKKRWICSSSRIKGKIIIDNGAIHAIAEKDRSLLPAGIIEVKGDFKKGDIIGISGPNGIEVARGIINYSSTDLQKIVGMKTQDISRIIGKTDKYEAVHKDNLVVIN